MTLDKTRTEKDAEGQFARSQGDRRNNGLASATPRTVTGNDDATMEHASTKSGPKAGFDEREQTNRRG